jgi:hypothetical protein
MSDMGEPYLSYLLRLWMVQNQEGNVWRCSVEDVQTGELHGFASLESLCDFLCEATGCLLDTAHEDTRSHKS